MDMPQVVKFIEGLLTHLIENHHPRFSNTYIRPQTCRRVVFRRSDGNSILIAIITGQAELDFKRIISLTHASGDRHVKEHTIRRIGPRLNVRLLPCIITDSDHECTKYVHAVTPGGLEIRQVNTWDAAELRTS